MAKHLGVATLLVVGAFASRPARAQVVCSTLPNPIYIQIGDTQEPLIKNIGKKLRDSTVAGVPMTIVYKLNGSCTNIDAMYNSTALTGSSTVNFVPTSVNTADPGYVAGWTPMMPSPTCTIDAAGQPIEIANSNVLISACNPSTTMPADVGAFQGPIQAYVFAVPMASSQTGISAEEAYMTFGFGGVTYQIMPWIDALFMFIRPITKSTLVSMAFNIGVPPPKWKGVSESASSDVVNALVNSTSPEKSIGILGAEVYDANRSTLKALAYRAYKQFYGYWPDSTPTATDKQNLRDGHYTIWSPTIYLAKIDTSGNPTGANAGRLVNMILGKPVTPSDPAIDPLAIEISRGLVPQCAMKVNRSIEGGDLSLYSDPAPCGCFYESKVGTTSCTACSTSSPCATGTCRYGYCEAR
jgi:hypothetical protein